MVVGTDLKGLSNCLPRREIKNKTTWSQKCCHTYFLEVVNGIRSKIPGADIANPDSLEAKSPFAINCICVHMEKIPHFVREQGMHSCLVPMFSFS